MPEVNPGIEKLIEICPLHLIVVKVYIPLSQLQSSSRPEVTAI